MNAKVKAVLDTILDQLQNGNNIPDNGRSVNFPVLFFR